MADLNIKDQLADDVRKTPYVWEAKTKDGLTIAVESPPGGPDTPFAAIGFKYRARFGRQPEDVHTFVSERPDTIIVTARSLRENILPNLDLEIEPGMALVWCHRVVIPFQIMGNASIPPYETMIYGREHANGLIEICQVWPNGEYKPFDSYKSAMEAL